MMTILSHFYNEEYMLPWWLDHHKKYFDHGILVNYGSSDSSVELINRICPTWQIVNSRNAEFHAQSVDSEIIELEKGVVGPRICLNVTEFLIGDFKNISETLYIPGIVMVDNKDEEYSYPVDLLKERTCGIPYDKDKFRGCRSLHYGEIEYPEIGRHFHNPNTDDFLILWYGFSPFNDETIKRKLQIQNKIPRCDKDINRGWQHFTDRDGLARKLSEYQKLSIPLRSTIDRIWKQ